jgi:hypothetical protein
MGNRRRAQEVELKTKNITCMKTPILCLCVAAGLVAGCANNGQHMGRAASNDHDVLTGGPTVGTTIQDLPQAVQDTLKTRAPHSEIDDINKTTRNGQVVYEIEFQEPGSNPELFVTEDGRVLSGSAGSPMVY